MAEPDKRLLLKACFFLYISFHLYISFCVLLYRKSTFGFFVFSIWVFFHEHSRIIGLQEKGEGISLTPYYHFPPLHRHLDISREITAESSFLHIASSRSWTGNLSSFTIFSQSRTLLNSFEKLVGDKFQSLWRRHVLSDYKGTRTYNHLVREQTLNNLVNSTMTSLTK